MSSAEDRFSWHYARCQHSTMEPDLSDLIDNDYINALKVKFNNRYAGKEYEYVNGYVIIVIRAGDKVMQY